MLAGLFGSQLRAKVLGWMMTHPGEWFFVRRLTAILGEDSTNLSRELARLAGMGILLRRTEGRQRYYRANEANPLFPELRGIAVKTTGTGDVLREALAPLAAGIRVAFVYGSVAEGREYAGSDVDVFVIGDAPLAGLVKALAPAQDALAREVNPVVYPPGEFAARIRGGNPFLARVLAGGKVFLIGDADELERLARQPLGDGARAVGG